MAKVAVKADRTQWDFFLREQEGTPAQVAHARHINSFRETHWKDIAFRLRQDYRIDALVEPHWVSPGDAWMWQEQFASVRKDGPDGPYREKQSRGWTPCGPLPLNTASQVAYYLKKGLRLRHPDDNIKDWLPYEAAVSPGGTSRPKEMKYLCDRHGFNHYGFPTWDGYRRHCERFVESIDLVPEFITATDNSNYTMTNWIAAKNYRWYCEIHNVGFKAHQESMAYQHMKKPHLRASARMTLADIAAK